ncbi:hypothetical protein EF903_17995 [Streptomyces sp. WAC05292]|uniref:hypothetical protein n=1 Tax=Streptomyces sp. WAC05292 TaxID=2487418 RepID=UPI000F73B307|nr:hypothetical protein [Streptomyces sp. WAC05292]RSS87004.1 hypothetical protein EF903_17995 [Streptomyces sp. WAC05292]
MSVNPTPVILAKRPEGWQVLYYAESPLTGEQWADLPVHSVIRTVDLLAGQDWDVVDARLKEQGLKRYGFLGHETDSGDPVPVSAGHALHLARKLWEEEGPYAAWWDLLANEADELEALYEEYAPTPDQKREAFEYAVAAVANPAPAMTWAELHAIATGDL